MHMYSSFVRRPVFAKACVIVLGNPQNFRVNQPCLSRTEPVSELLTPKRSWCHFYLYHDELYLRYRARLDHSCVELFAVDMQNVLGFFFERTVFAKYKTERVTHVVYD